MSPHWDEKSVFLAALALPPEDREAFLDGACPTPEARARMTALLKTLEEGPTASPSAASTALSPDIVPPPLPPSSSRPRPLLPTDPTRIDEFTILGRIGQGGMGVVYLAQDTLLLRQVAIKVLASHLTGSEEALGRFRDEAKTAALLQNPGIVQVHKFGYDGLRHYIVSEYVAGMTLKELIAQESQRRQETQTTAAHARHWRRRIAEICARVADALEHSHRANVVHRDVKPSNILIDPEDLPKLNDFGIAKHLVPEAPMEFTQGLGSCHYMSPEQAALAGSRVDRRSDIFSLGVVLYEALALRKPFDGDSPEDILVAVRTKEPTPLRSIDSHIPRDLETICLKSLEKAPDRRYQTAMHLTADLRCFLEGAPIMARPTSVPRRAFRWAAKHRAGFVTLAIVLLASGLATTLWLQHRASEAAMGWLSIESSPPGLSFVVQPFDRTTLELLPINTLAGVTPLRSQKLAMGQYRVTVTSSDHASFAEFNTLVLDPGPDNQVTLVVHAPGGELPPGLSSSTPHRTLASPFVPTTQIVAEDMVLIPEGEYVFGWTDEAESPIRRRTIRVDSFYLDRTLVSNAQYRAFMDATGYPSPRVWIDFGYDPALDEKPVVGITALDAEAYARWRGKRLPTAIEWQAAARGPDQRRFPWGDTPDPSIGIEPAPEDLVKDQSWNPEELYALYASHTTSTRAADNMGHPLHLSNMYGPLREYTCSLGEGQRSVLIVGRAWSDSPSETDMTRIYSYPLDNFSFKHGFRCARSAAPPPTPISIQSSDAPADPLQEQPPILTATVEDPRHEDP